MTDQVVLPICQVCNKSIYPSQFRIKAWNQEMNFETKERRFIHASHIPIRVEEISETASKEISKKTLLEFLDLLKKKRTSLSQANLNDIQAIAIGWMDIELTDIWDPEYIADLRPEFLGLVMKHKMWAEEARKEKDNASD